MQNNNTLDASKRVGVDSKNVANTSANPVLPYWDNNEINKRLEEHTKFLAEWEELLNKTGGPEVTSISQQDATRHIVLKRKLHESLGVMARIVQNQLKMKKPASESVSSGAAPVMVSNVSVPTQSGVYAQQGQVNSYPLTQQNVNNNNMLLTSYQQQGVMDYGKQMAGQQAPVSQDPSQQQQQQYNNGYVQSTNAYVPNGGNQYYTYNPNVNSGNGNGQMQGQMQGQSMTQPMYIPAYNNANYSTNPNVNSAQNYSPSLTNNMNTNFNNANVPNNVNGNTGYSGVMYTTYPTNPVYNAPLQGNLQHVSTSNAMPSTTTNTTPANNNAYTYNTSSSMYSGSDGASLLYSQQMLQQVPTSYYGNSSTSTTAKSSVPSNSNSNNTTSNTTGAMHYVQQGHVQPVQHQQPQPSSAGYSNNNASSTNYAAAQLPAQYSGQINAVLNSNGGPLHSFVPSAAPSGGVSNNNPKQQ